MSVVILGLGFTARRLAPRLLARGIPVHAVVRNPERFRDLETRGVRLQTRDLPHGAVWIHSVPPLGDDNFFLRDLISTSKPSRIIYISSTGVYGPQRNVSSDTLVAPNNDKQRARAAEELWLADPRAPWSCLILRSAAIYGPGRGVHMKLREGKLPRRTGEFVSRIHADDLAAILDAGIDSPLAGAWPVADDQPAASEEVAAWCARMMGISLPVASAEAYSGSGRRVDGREIRKLLGVNLTYPSYREGYSAIFEEERRGQQEKLRDQ